MAAVIGLVKLSDGIQPRLCENASDTDLGKKTASQVALYAFFLTQGMVRRPLNFRFWRVFTQPQPLAVLRSKHADCWHSMIARRVAKAEVANFLFTPLFTPQPQNDKRT